MWTPVSIHVSRCDSCEVVLFFFVCLDFGANVYGCHGLMGGGATGIFVCSLCCVSVHQPFLYCFYYVIHIHRFAANSGR